ncbi:MAG: hypothetical protein IJ218_01995 [Alphaproteobacteria bacterium]|nr:hypothetical protein [Alphaproteobacteria bacterium]
MLLIEFRHRAVVDSIGRLKEFVYKNTEGNIIKTTFRQNKRGTEIIFTDGTCVTLHNSGLNISRHNLQLSFDKRQEFAATYIDTLRIPPQNFKSGNTR